MPRLLEANASIASRECCKDRQLCTKRPDDLSKQLNDSYKTFVFLPFFFAFMVVPSKKIDKNTLFAKAKIKSYGDYQ